MECTSNVIFTAQACCFNSSTYKKLKYHLRYMKSSLAAKAQAAEHISISVISCYGAMDSLFSESHTNHQSDHLNTKTVSVHNQTAQLKHSEWLNKYSDCVIDWHDAWH